MWWVAANILNKQSLIADKRWSSSLGVGQRLTILRRKILACHEMLFMTSGLDEDLFAVIRNTVLLLRKQD
jgi:hypothetical protein